MNSEKKERKLLLQYPAIKSVSFLKIKSLNVCKIFFLSRRLVLHFAYISAATIAGSGREKRRCNFVLTASANKTMAKVTVCSYAVIIAYGISAIALHCSGCIWVSESATMPLHHTINAIVHLRKKHFPATCTSHTYSIYYCCSGVLVCLLSIFAHWLRKFNHMLKWTLLRLSFSVIPLSCFGPIFPPLFFTFNLLIWPSSYDKTFKKYVCMCECPSCLHAMLMRKMFVFHCKHIIHLQYNFWLLFCVGP